MIALIQSLNHIFHFSMGGTQCIEHTLNFWILDPLYKELVCLKEFVGHEQVVQLVVQYDQQCLVPMLV